MTPIFTAIGLDYFRNRCLPIQMRSDINAWVSGYGVLNFGHWNLFVIWDLKFVISK
jgi:hypothetical protein